MLDGISSSSGNIGSGTVSGTRRVVCVSGGDEGSLTGSSGVSAPEAPSSRAEIDGAPEGASSDGGATNAEARGDGRSLGSCSAVGVDNDVLPGDSETVGSLGPSDA